MNPHHILLQWLALLFLIGGNLYAQRDDPGRNGAGEAITQSSAPYFEVRGGNAGADPLPLKSTDVEVKVAGVIADVRIRQVYENQGSAPLEAVYLFPGSTRAAVHGMEMKVGGRVIKAAIAPRQKAREDYEKAKGEGKRAGLLEQHRPNVFQMNVAQILPGDLVTVELRYTELTEPQSGEYEFVFPTVVGPRYQHRSAAPGRDQWVANPYLKTAGGGMEPGADGPAEPAPGVSRFHIAIELATGIPIADLSSPTHPVDIRFTDADKATVSLKPGTGADAGAAAPRDFVLRYRLAGERIASGLLLSQGEKENFFTLLVEPPARVTPAAIPPRDYLFVIDVSGSMHGFPLDTGKRMLAELLGSLRQEDTFNIIHFSGSTGQLSPRSLPATPANIRAGIGFVDRFDGGGGTELLPALQLALALPDREEQSRSIVVITDGYVMCEAEAYQLIRSQRNRANLYAFGIGSSVNRHLIESMARAGGGTPFFILQPSEIAHELARFRRYVEAPLLTKIQLVSEGFEIEAVEPAAIGDLLAERPITLMGKWKGKAEGELILSGYTGEGRFEKRIAVREARSIEGSDALAYLWARTRIAHWSDLQALEGNGKAAEAIRGLGMAYHLLTNETSFIAVDETPVNPGGEAVTVKQPLPLPHGVSEFAIAAGSAFSPIPSTPEPETWALLGVLAAIGLVRAFRVWLRGRAGC